MIIHLLTLRSHRLIPLTPFDLRSYNKTIYVLNCELWMRRHYVSFVSEFSLSQSRSQKMITSSLVSSFSIYLSDTDYILLTDCDFELILRSLTNWWVMKNYIICNSSDSLFQFYIGIGWHWYRYRQNLRHFGYHCFFFIKYFWSFLITKWGPMIS